MGFIPLIGYGPSGISASGVTEVFCHLCNSGLLVPGVLNGGLVAIVDIVENTMDDLLLNIETAIRARKGPLGKLQPNKRMHIIFNRSY